MVQQCIWSFNVYGPSMSVLSILVVDYNDLERASVSTLKRA